MNDDDVRKMKTFQSLKARNDPDIQFMIGQVEAAEMLLVLALARLSAEDIDEIVAAMEGQHENALLHERPKAMESRERGNAFRAFCREIRRTFLEEGHEQ